MGALFLVASDILMDKNVHKCAISSKKRSENKKLSKVIKIPKFQHRKGNVMNFSKRKEMNCQVFFCDEVTFKTFFNACFKHKLFLFLSDIILGIFCSVSFVFESQKYEPMK